MAQISLGANNRRPDAASVATGLDRSVKLAKVGCLDGYVATQESSNRATSLQLTATLNGLLFNEMPNSALKV